MNIHKYQLFWCELQGYYWFWHTAIFVYHIQSNIYGIQTNFPPYDPMLTSASAEAWTQFSLTPGHLGIDSGCKMLVSWWGEEYIGDYQLVNVGHVVWQFRGTPHIHTYSTYCIYIYTVIIYIYIIYIYSIHWFPYHFPLEDPVSKPRMETSWLCTARHRRISAAKAEGKLCEATRLFCICFSEIRNFVGALTL